MQLNLADNQKLMVKVGDHFGFTWVEGGVIKFSSGSFLGNYCEADGTRFAINRTDILKLNRYGNREYSIRMYYGEYVNII